MDTKKDPPLLMPDGMPYRNTDKCDEFTSNSAKYARYLHKIPGDAIKDHKHPAPVIHAQYSPFTDPDFEIEVPDLADPEIGIYGINNSNVQPYHLEVWIEKSSFE